MNPYQHTLLILYLMVYFTPIAFFWVPITSASVVLFFVLFFVHMFAITIAYHRYFSHRSFKTSRVFQFILAWLAQSTTQKSVLWWANYHRHHHIYSDRPDDVHSPRQSGFWYSHFAWIFDEKVHQPYQYVKDLQKYPELVWLDRYDLLPSVCLGIFAFLVAGLPGLFFGYFFNMIVVWNATYTINSLCHVYGSQRYNTGDDSRNNFWLALLTFGEGWHNNHHYYPASCRQGFFWYEIDLSYYLLCLLNKLGIIWDLNVPKKALLEQETRTSTIANEGTRYLLKSTGIALDDAAKRLAEFASSVASLSNIPREALPKATRSLAGRARELYAYLEKQSAKLPNLPPKLHKLLQSRIDKAKTVLQRAFQQQPTLALTSYVDELRGIAEQFEKISGPRSS